MVSYECLTTLGCVLPVDDSEQVLLASFDNPSSRLTRSGVLVGVLAVEQVVGGSLSTSGCGVLLGQVEDALIPLLINHDSTKIQVVVRCSRSVDNDRTTNTSTVLRQQMAVVPSGTIGGCNPCVGSALTRSDTTFGDTWNTILVVGAVLQDTMPVNSGCVACHLVGDCDYDCITPVRDNCITWSLAIDGEACNGFASISINHGILNNEVVTPRLASLIVVASFRVDALAATPA